MLIVDLYCGAGGASAGYAKAGWTVVGIDVEPQPNYPFTFVQADALDVLDALHEVPGIHAVHASPPCQNAAAITKGTNAHLRHKYPNLYPQTLAKLQALGLPYVIENPDSRPDVILCGEMFGLGVLRHRNFELGGWHCRRPVHLRHRGRVRGWRHGEYFDGPYVAVHGDGGGKASLQEAQDAMGIDWMTYPEIIQAIPPAYTEFIGKELALRLKGR